MEKLDLRYYAKIHSIESFGTVDGPWNKICYLSPGVSPKM